MAGVLAYTTDGRITKCTCPPDKRGRGRCNHITHIQDGESYQDFLDRSIKEAEQINKGKEPAQVEADIPAPNPITKEEVDEYKERLYEILGTRDVTPDNLSELINKLTPNKQNELMQLGFEAAPYFGFESDIDREEVSYENAPKIKLSNMGEYGIGAKKKHISQIMDRIGAYVTKDGETEIDGNYVNGLSSEEYWKMMWATRRASVNKTVSIAVPGYSVYEKQIVEVVF